MKLKIIYTITLIMVIVSEVSKGIWNGVNEMWSYWRCYVSMAWKDYKQALKDCDKH